MSDTNIPGNNGAILNIAHIIKHVMSSATEAELAALYIMAREAVYIRIILEGDGPQANANSNADGQRNGRRSYQQKGSAKTNERNGYEIPLAPQQRMPRAI